MCNSRNIYAILHVFVPIRLPLFTCPFCVLFGVSSTMHTNLFICFCSIERHLFGFHFIIVLYNYQTFFRLTFNIYAYNFVDVSCPVTRLMNVSPSSSSFKLSMCLSRCRNRKFTMADMGSCFSLIAA